jgi:hypothetical protein
VRVDGAFVLFAEDFDLNKVTPRLRHLGKFGVPEQVDLNRPVGSYVGLRVLKEGRTTGLTKGTIIAAFVEHEDATGLNIFVDFLVVGDQDAPFDEAGDSGSVVLMQVCHSLPFSFHICPAVCKMQLYV